MAETDHLIILKNDELTQINNEIMEVFGFALKEIPLLIEDTRDARGPFYLPRSNTIIIPSSYIGKREALILRAALIHEMMHALLYQYNESLLEDYNSIISQSIDYYKEVLYNEREMVRFPNLIDYRKDCAYFEKRCQIQVHASYKSKDKTLCEGFADWASTIAFPDDAIINYKKEYETILALEKKLGQEKILEKIFEIKSDDELYEMAS